jgi:endonuclease/exonuclease/phosphatase family metal-dependent hydrolase
VNWGQSTRQVKSPASTLNAIRKLQGDIVLLQETTPFWQHYFEKNLPEYHYQAYHDYPRAGGLGFLAKYPFKTLKYAHSKIGWHPAWLILIKTPIGEITILNVHLSPPLINEHSMGFMMRALLTTRQTRLEEISFYEKWVPNSYPSIIGGDFNANTTEASVKYLTLHGYHNAFYLMPKCKITWYWHIGGPFTLKDTYDHLFYSSRLAAKNVQVLAAGDSDHYPIAVDFS